MAREYTDFPDLESAECFAQAREDEGFAAVSIKTNTPRPGRFEVGWGHAEHDSSFSELMSEYGKIFAEREAREEAAHRIACERLGRAAAAHEFAEAAGLFGRDAEVFCAGFIGLSAKTVNPRAEGREDLFRAGRQAWGGKEGQAAFRRCAVAARRVVQREPKPFFEGGAIASGE